MSITTQWTCRHRAFIVADLCRPCDHAGSRHSAAREAASAATASAGWDTCRSPRSQSCAPTFVVHEQAFMCLSMCVDMCLDMCLDMCTVVCLDACTDMCLDVCADMCIDISSHQVHAQLRSASKMTALVCQHYLSGPILLMSTNTAYTLLISANSAGQCQH